MPWPKVEPKTFASIRELNGISQRTMEEHYELYKGYVGKTNEIQEKLDTVDRASREPDLQRPARAARRSVVRDRRREEPRDLLRAPGRQGRHAGRPADGA